MNGAEYAQPWSFIPGFTEINDAFNNALTGAIEGTGTAQDIANADQGRHRQQPAVTARTGAGPGPAATLAHPQEDAMAARGQDGGHRRGLRAERRSEAIAGYTLIAIPLLLFLVLNIGADLLRAVHQLLRLGRPGGPREFLGLAQLPGAAERPDLLEGDPEHALLHAHRGAAPDGPRAVPGGHRQPEDPRPDVLPGGVLLPGDRELGRDHRAVPVHARARRAVQRGPRGAGPQPAVRGARLRRPTRTGSATAGRRSTP